jgi:hypothetical protein
VTIDEAVAAIRDRGFFARPRPELGPNCIYAARQTYYLEDDLKVLEPSRQIVSDGSGWAVLEAVGQIPRSFIPATYVRTEYATLDEAVSAVIKVLEVA